jgi:hypothetical protein
LSTHVQAADPHNSEVHRAKSRKTGAVVALKKILMHNEKDGVGFSISTTLRRPTDVYVVSHYSLERNKASEASSPPKYIAARGNGCRAFPEE